MKVPKFLKDGDGEDSPEKEESLKKPATSAAGGPPGRTPSSPGKDGGMAFGDKTVMKLGVDVDKLKAQVAAFSEMRQANDQRLARINEEIGDLRRRAIEREKDVNKIRAEATKAIQLVDALEPEKIMEALAKKDMHIEKAQAKTDLNKKLIDNLSDEIKGLRQSMGAFKSTEELLKINQDIKADLLNLKKTQAAIDRQAGKIEQIFVTVSQRFNDYERLSGKLDSLESRFQGLLRESDKFRTEMDSYAGKTELVNLQHHLDQRLSRYESQMEKHTALITEGYNLILELKELRDLLRTSQRDLGWLKKHGKATPTRAEVDAELKDMYAALLEKIESK